MSFSDGLPVSETIGVFLGVSGIDWLTDGDADPSRAVIAAVAVGAVIYLARHFFGRRRQD